MISSVQALNIPKLNVELFNWLSLATKGDGKDWQSYINVCGGALWTSDGVRLNCIGNPEKTKPVIASYTARNVTRLKHKILSHAPSELPKQCTLPPSVDHLFDVDTGSNFEATASIRQALYHVSNISTSVRLILKSGSLSVNCSIPVFETLPTKRIGDCNGNGEALSDSQLLYDAVRFGGLVEIPKRIDHAIKVTKKYDGVLLTALVMPMRDK